MTTSAEKFKCDGKPGCTNGPDHQHTGKLGAKTTYHCSACCAPKDCPEAIGKGRL